MPIRPKTQIGVVACLCCAHEVPVKTTETGTLSFPCPWCDFPGYAKAGTEAHRIVSGRMKQLPDPAQVPPAPAKAKTIFGR